MSSKLSNSMGRPSGREFVTGDDLSDMKNVGICKSLYMMSECAWRGPRQSRYSTTLASHHCPHKSRETLMICIKFWTILNLQMPRLSTQCWSWIAAVHGRVHCNVAMLIYSSAERRNSPLRPKVASISTRRSMDQKVIEEQPTVCIVFWPHFSFVAPKQQSFLIIQCWDF